MIPLSLQKRTHLRVSHMKKLGIALFVLLTCFGCSKQPHVESPVTQNDCHQLYVHMQVLEVLNDVDPEHDLNHEQFAAAMWELDHRWQDEGRTDRFYRVCPQMSRAQMNCALHTTKVEDIDNCVRMMKR